MSGFIEGVRRGVVVGLPEDQGEYTENLASLELVDYSALCQELSVNDRADIAQENIDLRLEAIVRACPSLKGACGPDGAVMHMVRQDEYSVAGLNYASSTGGDNE